MAKARSNTKKANKSAPASKARKGKHNSPSNQAQEPAPAYNTPLSRSKTKLRTRSRLRAIGNSKGVILSNKMIAAAGLSPDAEVEISAMNGQIMIHPVKEEEVHTDLASWDGLFKKAKSKGSKPEKDMFEGLSNAFDEKEWS